LMVLFFIGFALFPERFGKSVEAPEKPDDIVPGNIELFEPFGQ
jgi:hypothetical protein